MTSPLSLPCPSDAADATRAIGPVARHRIAQIRRRMRDGRYALDSLALAGEIARSDLAVSPSCGSIAPMVQQLLALAIDRLDQRDALVLQLEFVEQLAAAEIAVTVGTSASELADARKAALLGLKALLDSGATYR
jgi:DNA-directed RNA polymerase specialized sigma24 family protein